MAKHSKSTKSHLGRNVIKATNRRKNKSAKHKAELKKRQHNKRVYENTKGYGNWMQQLKKAGLYYSTMPYGYNRAAEALQIKAGEHFTQIQTSF